ncbi:MAG: glycoside hydrolase family 6 protein [Solirubrobacteraceae bacterium]
MTFARRPMLLLGFLLLALLAPAMARADRFQRTGFRLQSAHLYVHERDGQAVIEVTRRATRNPAQVRYGAWRMSGQTGIDFAPVGGRLDFSAGQSSASFSVPIVDHGVPGVPKTVKVGLYGASPIGLGSPSTATLTIVNDDVVQVKRIPTNPLALAAAPLGGDPLGGAHFYVDHVWGLAAREAQRLRHRHPSWAGLLDVIAAQPETHRFGSWDGPHPGNVVQAFLERAYQEQPGTVPMIAVYRLVHRKCGHAGDSPAAEASYRGWIQSFARGLSSYRAVIYLEMDSLITEGCLSGSGLRTRMRELNYAIDRLSALPRTVVYLDAGAADALPAYRTAHLLRLAGVQKIQGFFLNSTHNDWTSREIRYGQQISRMTGGKHFVVSTAANGRGPLVPSSRVRHGNEVLCNPPGRGLGPKPTWDTGYPAVDAFAWIGNPGRSGGACRPGSPPTGVFWDQYAMMLVKNAVWSVR